MKNQPKKGQPLHVQIALGKKPSQFQGAAKGGVPKKK